MVRNTARPLLVLHQDAALLAQLRAASRQCGFGLRVFADRDDVDEALRTAPASAIAVVDPYWGTHQRHEPFVELASLLNRYPSASVVAALALAPGYLDQVRRLGEWGVVQVLDLDEPVTARELSARLLGITGRPLRNLVERTLPMTVNSTARSILTMAAAVISEGGGAVDLARMLHVTQRTVSRWCRRAGLPPPKRLLAWMRVLLAAELLDDAGRTVSDVALACGYASDGSLRYSLRSFVGESPSALRATGAFAAVSRAFIRDLEQARDPLTRYRARRGGAP
jgi:AraC-like DNA-binding protein